MKQLISNSAHEPFRIPSDTVSPRPFEMKPSKPSSPYKNRLALLRRPTKITRALAFAAVLTLTSSAIRASNYYWDPTMTGTGAGSGGTGTWDTTSNFWLLSGGTADTTWPNTSANTADFAGAAGTVTLGSAITTGGLIFDTAGYTLGTSTYALSLGTSGITSNITSGTTTINGAITSLGSQNWTVASGGTLAMGATYTSAASTNYNLTLTGASTVNITGGTSAAPNVVTGVFTAGGGSTVNVSGYLNTTSSTVGSTKFTVNGGSTVNWSGTGTQSGIYTGIADGSAGTMKVTAGSFNASPSGDTFIGNGATGLLNIAGGTVTIGSSTAVYLGDGYAGGGSTGSGTITVGGGQFTTGTTTGSFVLGSASLAGTGTVNLNGGTFSSNRALTGTAGKATIAFNGGTLQATGTALSTSTGIAMTIADNGATLDSNGNTITINSTIAHAGTAATDGGLTIKSTNALTILSPGANNTYTGPTTVNGGELQAFGAGILPLSTGAVTVASGANVTVVNHAGGTSQTMANNFTLNGAGKSISAASNSATASAGALAFFNSGGFALTGNVNLASTSVIVDDPQAQTGNITFSGTISGAGGLVLAGGNSSATAINLALSGANTYGTTTPTTQFTNANGGGTMTVTLNTNNTLPTNTVLTLGGTPTGQAGSYNAYVNVSLNGINQTVAGLQTATGATGVYRFIGNSATFSTLTVNDAANYTFGGIFGSTGTNNNNVALTKNGAGTLALTGASTYTGATTINGGTLDIGGSTANGAIGTATTPSSALALGGGTMAYTRTGTNTQSFTGTTINSGASNITNSVSTDTLALGAITRNVGGTVNFTGPGTITTTTANTNSIIGGYATYGLNDWAASAGTGTAAGAITALNTYFVSDDVANLANNTANGTSNVTDSNGFNATYTNSLTINSLRFNASNSDSNFGIVSGNNLTLNSGGILVTNNVGQKYQRIGFLNTNFTAGQGQGTITSAGSDLIINENNSSSGHLEIYSIVTGNIGLTKSGVGYFELRGLDADYTGVTTVNGGTMQLTAATTGTSGVVINGGTLLLGANDRINDAAMVTLNGGTLNTGGFQEGRATGTAAATTGLGALTLSNSSTLDFGSGHSGSSVLAFADSHTQTWNGTLTLADFTVGMDELNFGSNTGLTTTQLAEISLNGFTATGLDSFGDVTFSAVPEPATYLGGLLTVGAAIGGWRRRVGRRTA